MKNTLYLLEMGMNDNNIGTDLKNHRVRTLENVDIIYNGTAYNMFFEFTQCVHWHYRRENKRTGAPLKHPVYTVDVKDGLGIDTQYEKVNENGFEMSYRCRAFEAEFWAEHREYTRRNILEVVNRYKVGAPFTDVKLVDETAAGIIRKIGGWRELDILNSNDSYFEVVRENWDDEHKIVRCHKRYWEYVDDGKTYYYGSRPRKWITTGETCDVDLVTGRITG